MLFNVHDLMDPAIARKLERYFLVFLFNSSVNSLQFHVTVLWKSPLLHNTGTASIHREIVTVHGHFTTLDKDFSIDIGNERVT